MDASRGDDRWSADVYKRQSLTIARSAVKPIASTILAILCVLELARVSTRADGDREPVSYTHL